MDLWMDCRQKHKYVYTDNLKRTSSGTFKMNRGTYFHRLCHFFYDLKKQNLQTVTVNSSMAIKMQRDFQGVTTETLSVMHSVLPLVDRYITERSPEIDGNIQVLATEYEYWVPLVTPKGRIVALHGIIDLVYRNNWNRLRIRDHKTSERVDMWSNDKIKFNPQLRHYDLALSIYNQWNLPVDGVEINFINTAEYGEKSKAKGKEIPWDLFTGDFNQVQRDEFKRDLLHKIDLILDGDVFRNYHKDCDKCSHYPICYRDEKGLPTAATIATQFERINRKQKIIANQPGNREESESTSIRLPDQQQTNLSLSLNLPRRE